MSDQVSRFEDLERTDVLPQLGFQPDDSEFRDSASTGLHAQPGSNLTRSNAEPQTPSRKEVAPFGASVQAATGRLHTLPAKPSTTDLALGGIRGKIADLESKLLESQDHEADLARHCEQLAQRCVVADERAAKAEASYLAQASDLARATQRATEAEQRNMEQRVQLQAQIVDIEGQLADARLRSEKRTATLEKLLNEETERATRGERSLADVRIETERLRAEHAAAQTMIASLEERLTKQTQSAAEISKLYAEQTTRVTSIATAMESDQQALAAARNAKSEADAQIAALREQVRQASESSAKVQSEIDVQRRHIAALEQGLATRDRANDELKANRVAHERAHEEWTAAKFEMEKRLHELREKLEDAQLTAAGRHDDASRLGAVLRNSELRIEELTATKSAIEQQLHERDAEIAQVSERVAAMRRDALKSDELAESLRQRLEKQEQDIDALQAQLHGRHSDLERAQQLVVSLQREQDESQAHMSLRRSEFEALQKTTQKLMAERDQLDLENQAGRAELAQTQSRYDEAVQTVMAARESIAMRDQQTASLERELRATTQRLEEAHARIERAAAQSEAHALQVHERDERIGLLEQKLLEHAAALNAIGQDIERVNAASPNDKLSAMGYALESLDAPGTVHRITRMTTTAGRSNSNDIEINSTSVSRFHARIVVKPEGVWLIDLQSTNGCAINGRRVSRQILCDGDAVRIGHCMFRFSMLGADAAKSIQSAAVKTEPLPAPIPSANNAETRIQHH